MLEVGITQGRLSRPVNGKIQSFPEKSWKEEFYIANSIGFSLIEWIIDEDLNNPIFKKDFNEELAFYKKSNNINVTSLSCDYFMHNSLSAESENYNKESFEILDELISKVLPLNKIDKLILPLINKTSLKNKNIADSYVEVFKRFESKLIKNNVTISLETDLNPKDLFQFLKKINQKTINLTYDTGNSAYWGYDYKCEMDLLSNNIKHVHIKDCVPSKYSVKLGQGSVDFKYIFSKLKEKDYRGSFILQAARGNDEIQDCTKQFIFTKKYISQYFT